MSVTVIIPTYNGGALWKQSAHLLEKQHTNIVRVKVIDSSSKDDSRSVAEQYAFEVCQIDQKDFDHGGTRTLALSDVDTDIVVFMTQDAILATEDAIDCLVSVLEQDRSIVCAYGRQLPHHNANPLAEHARMNSYRAESYITSLSEDFPKGFRKAFFSNSFAAYHTDFLKSIGGFPRHLILGEDSFVAAKALVSGKKVAYVAEAKVRHSHNYTVVEEFKRYFDIGVFHSTQQWMLDELGQVEGEGVKFAIEQIRFLIKRKRFKWVLLSVMASAAKYLGYKLGRKHRSLGVTWSRRLSMYKTYWNRV